MDFLRDRYLNLMQAGTRGTVMDTHAVRPRVEISCSMVALIMMLCINNFFSVCHWLENAVN